MKKNLEAEFSNIIVHQDFFVNGLNNEKRVFYALAGECIDNNIYLYSTDSNSICKINTDTGNMEILYGDNDKPYCEKHLYLKSVSYRHIVCFISERAQNVLKFNTITGKKEWISFKSNTVNLEPILYENLLFLFPVGYSEQLICIDIENNTVKYSQTKYNLHLTNVQGEKYIFGEAIRIDEYVYRGSYLESSIEKFNIKTGMFEYIKVKRFNRPIKSISYDGKYFWILSSIDGVIARWDEKNNKIIAFIDLEKETHKKGMLYAACVYTDGIVYIPEGEGTCLLELHVKEDLLLVYDCKKISGFKIKKQEGTTFANGIRIGINSAIYIFPFYTNGVIVKETNGNVHFYKTETTKGLKIADSQQMQNESIYTLNYFCQKVQKREKSITQKSDIGEQILHSVCKKVLNT